MKLILVILLIILIRIANKHMTYTNSGLLPGRFSGYIVTLTLTMSINYIHTDPRVSRTTSVSVGIRVRILLQLTQLLS